MPDDETLSILTALQLQQKMLSEVGCQVVALTKLLQEMKPEEFERGGRFHMLHLDAKTHSATAQINTQIQRLIDRLIRQQKASSLRS